MRAAAGLVLVCACGAKAAPPLANVEPADPTPGPILHYAHKVAMPRPPIDLSSVLPDPSSDARWPLAASIHPENEPRYDIAGALAEPGVTWQDLCALGAQNRLMPGKQDLITYLHAWCEVSRGNVQPAIEELARVRHSMILGMAPAVELDLADVLADTGGADDAERLLGRVHLIDPEMLDLLSATYIEIDKAGDATEINERAIEAGVHDPVAARCRRLGKRILLGPEARRDLNFKTLEEATKDTKDAVCHSMWHTYGCWIAVSDCKDYFDEVHLDASYVQLVEAYRRWPQYHALYDDWWDESQLAYNALGLPGADELALTALEAAFASSECDATRMFEIRSKAQGLSGRPHDHGLDDRLGKLAALDPPRCPLAKVGDPN